MNEIKSGEWNLDILGDLLLWSLWRAWVLWFLVYVIFSATISQGLLRINELHVKTVTEKDFHVSRSGGGYDKTLLFNNETDQLWLYNNPNGEMMNGFDDVKLEFDVGLFDIPFNPRVKEIIPYQPPESNQK